MAEGAAPLPGYLTGEKELCCAISQLAEGHSVPIACKLTSPFASAKDARYCSCR